MKRLVPFLLFCVAMLTACNFSADRRPVKLIPPEHDETNSVYYWKTVLSFDEAEQDFIKEHNIRRIYLRMFDVVKERYSTQPNATVRFDYSTYTFKDFSLDSIEFVPVVYITLDALKTMSRNEGVLAKNIVTRVRNMNEYNSLPNVRELQLDCDWTGSTQDFYFRLCDSVRHYISKLELPWNLSSTIRLHQLSKMVPPVDRGVLMVYNTGSFNNPDVRNSIIDIEDITPYLKHLPSYPLHLDIAYPTYSWQLLFRNRKFIGLTNGVDVNDTTKFIQRDNARYAAKTDIPHNGKIIAAEDVIRHETSDYSEIVRVKAAIEKYMNGHKHSNIIYHLDINNLSKYSSHEIQNIYSIGF